MRIRLAQSINVTEEDDVEIHLASDAANEDWLRAYRLLQATREGDESAKKEFTNLDNTSMMYVIDGRETE